MGLKRIGDANLYFRGMKSTVGMKSVPADMIVFDELDEATPDARAMAQERIAHSDYKRVIELSNPSLPGYGIDEQFEKSDQRHWTLKCPGCGHWTSLEREFPAKLGQEVRILLPRDDGTVYRACPKCQHELDMDKGEWVADYPDRATHGYRISQLFSSKVDPGEILEEYRTTRLPTRFYNLKIGIPWADTDRRVDPATVMALCRDVPETGAQMYPAMGVDTGKRHHVVILQESLDRNGPLVLAALRVCDSFADLDVLMKEYAIRHCVIDALPETHATRAFAGRHPGKVSMCFFVEAQRGTAKWDYPSRVVEINRTDVLDASRAVVREGRLVIPRGLSQVEEFARHMGADAKVLDEDPETGAQKFRYVKTGENHFSMAFTYACLALEQRASEPCIVPIPGIFRWPRRPFLSAGGWVGRYGIGWKTPREREEEEYLRRVFERNRKRREEPGT